MIIPGSKIHKAVRARTKKALCIFDPPNMRMERFTKIYYVNQKGDI